MHHRLAPDFILEKAEQQETNGRFLGTAMFLDVSGFSSIMDALMQHGQHGSEIMATLMRSLFEPLVQSVYGHGGYIVGFAGDAFTAVFPQTDAPPLLALASAWQIQHHLQQNDRYQTEYGEFAIGAKVGLAFGEIAWGILQSENGKRATFFYTGEAIQQCSYAEHLAQRQDIICHHSMMQNLPAGINGEVVGAYLKVTAVDITLPTPNPTSFNKQNVQTVSKFFPEHLVTQSITGEFRQIFNIFVNLEGTPPPKHLSEFMELVFSLQDQYGGLLNRIDFGDKGCHLLFFWGAPISYENDLSRVLGFVQALRTQSPLNMRMGITYRIAHAGFIGSHLHEEYTCYGRGVNLAARFMTSADWGDIWVDAEVADRARNMYRFDFLGERPFKGFAQPQTVYQLISRRQTAQAPFYEGRMIGRELEISQLQGMVHPLLNGRFAGVAVIIGEAGIGKSRLVHEFLEQATVLASSSSGRTAVAFRCQTDEIMRQSLNPFRYWLRDYFNQSPAVEETENKQAFTQVLDGLIAETAVAPGLRRELDRTRTILGSLVGLSWPDSLYESLEPHLRFENSLNALKTLIKAESARQPVIIQLEDAQWFDEDTWQFLKRLSRNIDRVPLLILITSRAAFPPTALEEDVPLTVISLDTLASEAISALIMELTDQKPSTLFVEWLMTRTEGNPFFVEQILYYLEENELLEQALSQFDVSSSTVLPTDVRSVLTARLDSLPQEVKTAVQTASVLGREFDSPVVLEMLANHPNPSQILETATNEAIWVLLSQIRYLFRHMLLRDAAYNMQVQSQLKTLHRQAARAYETVYEQDLAPYFNQIAYHYDQAVVTVKALAYYERAADRAHENYQNKEALEQYSRALALTSDSEIDRRYRLLLGKEAILDRLGQRDAQQETLAQLEAVLTLSPDQQRLSELCLRQAAFALSTNQYEQAIEAAKLSAETAVSINDPLAEARAYHRWGRAYWQQGQHHKATPYTEKARDLAVQHQAKDIEAQCLYDLAAIHYFNSESDASIQKLEHAFAIYQTLNDKSGAIRCLNLFGLLYDNAGAHGKAKAQYQLALEYCSEIGWRYGAARIMIQMGNNLLMLGDYHTSRSYHQQAEAICRELNDLEGQSASYDTIGLANMFENDLEQAQQNFERAIELANAHNHLRNIAYPTFHLGYCLIELKRYTQAKALLEQALTIRKELDDTGGILDVRSALAKLAFRQGQRQKGVIMAWSILSDIEKTGNSGLEFPVLVYLDCYFILSSAESAEHRHASQAALKKGYELLQLHANQIQEESIREQFLTAVPYNRHLISLWEAH